ncbi:hypothetical protein E4T42_00776 [Aureobasidium subglaciale]|nr:hypothetical protein E4T42_00776 [Aureobasidium subglaciale]
MATPNPLADNSSDPTPVSSKSYTIAGVHTTVYGIDELASSATEVAVLWLLHPRLQVQSIMAPIAAASIHDWNGRSASKSKGLIAVSFDQRNHGTREVNALANESWKKGNPTHAQDMFSIFRSFHVSQIGPSRNADSTGTDGTAQDTSMLIDFLSSYVFPDSSRSITKHLVLGISLGGHSTWQCILHDPRITTAVVVIGCPDYKFLMTDRAKKSKLSTWTSSEGKAFLGSTDYPQGLCDATDRWDPKSFLVGDKLQPTDDQKKTLRPLIKEKLGGKHILCLSGGKDKLVPYTCSAPFLDWMKSGLDKKDGWFSDQGIVLEDIVDETAGHEYSAKMKVEAVRFISENLAGEGSLKAGTRTSKI